MKRSMLYFLVIANMAGILSAFGCTKEKAAQEKPLRAVLVRPVEVYKDKEAKRFSANIAPKEQVSLFFKNNGYVDEILQVQGVDGKKHAVEKGDRVTKGTVIARIRTGDFQARATQAKGRLSEAQALSTQAESDYERAKDLYDLKSVTKMDYDQAKSKYENAKAGVAAAKGAVQEAALALKDCALTVPWDGVVFQRSIEPGALASPSHAAFIIGDDSSMKVVFGVPDIMVAAMKKGESINVSTEAFPGKTFKGTITAISPIADKETRVFNVEVTIPNREGSLKSGMIGSLEIEDHNAVKPYLGVPLTAIVKPKGSEPGYAVFVAEQKNGKAIAKQKKVALGEVYGKIVAVTEGLQAGEQIIITGASQVTDGEELRIIPGDPFDLGASP